jgi:hypothetical protein
VARARMASMALPGAGQFLAGDALGGAAFLTGDLVAAAGTLAGAYFLLPANVQFGSLDYLNASHAAVRTVWQSNSLSAYLPSLAVVAGGMGVQMLLRALASSNAEATARANVESGKVSFSPELVPFLEGGPDGRMRRMGLGLRLHF